MAQKKLNESQMREFVEMEVRKALMNENIGGNSILNESIDEVIAENMTDEGVLGWLRNLIMGNRGNSGAGNTGGISMEGIVGAILAQFLAPVLKKLLGKIGIDPEGPIGKVIIGAATTGGGFALGQWVDKKWDLIPGIDGKNPRR